jgi:hypothetical protein
VVVEPAEDALQLGLVDDLDPQDRLAAGPLDGDALQRLGEALGDLAPDHDLVADRDPP